MKKVKNPQMELKSRSHIFPEHKLHVFSFKLEENFVTIHSLSVLTFWFLVLISVTKVNLLSDHLMTAMLFKRKRLGLFKNIDR